MKQMLLYLLILLFHITETYAVTKELTPVDDTYAYSDNTIRGMEPTLKTYHSTAGSQFRRVIYLKFDISSFSNQINNSEIKIYCTGLIAGGDKAHIWDAYPVSINTWSEDDLTFSNASQKAGSDVISPVLASSNTYDAGLAIAPGYITLSGSLLTQQLKDSVNAGKKYFSVRIRERNVVKNGTSGVITEFHSKENSSSYSPRLVVEETDVEELKLADIKTDGVSLTGFNENSYNYIYEVEWNSIHIPAITATAKYPQSTVTITPATSLTGSISERTTTIVVNNATNSLRYSVVFEMLPPPTDATLSAIKIDGKTLEFFQPDKKTYEVYVPYSVNAVPLVEAITSDPKASIQIENAVQVVSTAPEKDRTISIKITAANGINSETYKLILVQLPEMDIFLAIGQSNMSGRANLTNEMMSPIENVYLLTPGGSVEIASNPMNKYSNIRKDISLQKLGPAYSCALKLREQIRKPIGFVVNAQGGSSITVWYQAGKANYDATLIRAKEAQKWGRIKAIIWHQGESDGSIVDSYLSRLLTMVQSFRRDLNEPELPVIAGELGYWRGGGTGSTAFNQMIRTISGTINNSDWVSAEGGNPLNNDPTDPHFDTESQLILGQRYADKLIQHLYISNITDNHKKKDPVTYQINKNEIRLKSEEYLLYTIAGINGQQIFQGKLYQNNDDRITLPQGLYILNINNDKINFTGKIIIP